MRSIRGICAVIAIALTLCAMLAATAEPFRFPEAKHGQGELRYINDVPVMILAGAPTRSASKWARWRRGSRTLSGCSMATSKPRT